MKKFSTIAILALMVVGCNNNYDNVEPTVEGTPMTIVATTADDAAEGRTALNTADGKTVVWKTGDKIGVFGQYNNVAISKDGKYQNEFTLTSGDGTASGEFEGVVAGLDEVETNVEGQFLRYNAYYPLNAANANKKQFQLVGTLNALQSYDVTAEYNDMSADDVLVGRYINGTKEDTTIPFVFQHLFAMMTFEVSNPTAEPIVVNKVEMTTEEGLYLSGSYTLNLTKFPYGTQTAVFNSGSASVGVSVSNGSVAAGQKINARLIFNRWAATDGKALTVKVYTDKGVQTFNKTATDFSGNNSWGLRLAVDPTAMEKEIVTVDNYVAGMKEITTSSTFKTAGTYCVMEDVDKTDATKGVISSITADGDVNIIGRYTIDGVPQQTFKSTIGPCQGTTPINILVKDLIWYGTWLTSGGPQRYVTRLDSKSNNTITSITIDNCIIDCQNASGGAVFIFCNDLCGIENITIKNCIIRNFTGNYVAEFITEGSSKINSLTFENNVIETTTTKAKVANFFKFNDGHTITVSYEGSTVVKVQ